MKYSKPHLTLDQQLQLLADRGLDIDDWELRKADLAAIGYYRLAAYLYPFRRLKPSKLRTTDWNFRFDEFEDGARFGDAIALYDFDCRLRRLLFDGLEKLEVSLRSQIANVAGEVDTHIHLRRELLDPRECGKRPRGSDRDSYQLWFSKYRGQLERASGEDFVKHHKARYGETLPVWVVMEIIDFGSVTYLFNFLPVATKNSIARNYGVTQGTIFASWLRAFNYMRNLVAHHSRVWNRVMVTRPRIPGESAIGPEVHHLEQAQSNKIYPLVALLGYSLSSTGSVNVWNSRAVDVFDGFPEIPKLSLESAMGFPSDWRSLDLWAAG